MEKRVASIAFLASATFTFASFQPYSQPNSNPTFSDDIAPIIVNKCLPCHQPNGVGPFDFTTARNFNRHIELIRVQTLSRNMPPTHVVSDFGSFALTPQLTDPEIVTIQKYISSGMAEGEPLTKALTRPIVSISPTFSIKAGIDYQVPREGVQYWFAHVVTLPRTKLNLSSLSLVPNSSKTLRGAQIYTLKPTAKVNSGSLVEGIFVDDPEATPLANWAPGYPDWKLPEHTTETLEPGTRLLVVASYQPSGRVEDGGFTIQLTTKEEPSQRELQIVTFEKKELFIKANDGPIFTIGKEFTHPGEVIGVIPQARFFCGIVKGSITSPEGQRQNLFHIERWDPYRMGSYIFEEPIVFSASTDLKFEFTYFNDDRCQINENKSPEDVTSGPTLEHELCRIHVLLSRPR